MALATTTLSSACAQGDVSIVVASATSVAAGRLIVIDQEEMQVAQSYSSGTTVPVLRGRDGSAQVDRKSTRLNSSHRTISYAVFCLKKKKKIRMTGTCFAS